MFCRAKSAAIPTESNGLLLVTKPSGFIRAMPWFTMCRASVLQRVWDQDTQEFVYLRFHVNSNQAVARLDLAQQLLTFAAHDLRIVVNPMPPFLPQGPLAHLPASLNLIPIHFGVLPSEIQPQMH